MKIYEATGKNYEEALQNGLEYLRATISDVTVETIEEGSKGLFGLFGSRPCKLRLTLREEETEEVEEEDPLADLIDSVKVEEKPVPQPKPAQPKQPKQPKADKVETPKAEAPKAEAPKAETPKAEEKVEAPVTEAAPVETAEETTERPAQRRNRNDRPRKEKQPRQNKQEGENKPAKAERKPLPPKTPVQPLEKPVVTMIPNEEVDPASLAGQAQSFLKELTHLMGVEVDVAVGLDKENNIFVQMTGDTLGILIGRRGETLDALQYLTSLRINKGQSPYTRVTLDTENYRAKREDTLMRLANRMANRAIKTGRKVSLEPMNPYERRVIHSALQPNELVETHSEGEEPKRHIVITLRK